MAKDYSEILTALREITEIVERCATPSEGRKAESMAVICREKGLDYVQVRKLINSFPKALNWELHEEGDGYYGDLSLIDTFYSFLLGVRYHGDEDILERCIPMDAVEMLVYLCNNPGEFGLKPEEGKFIELFYLEGMRESEAFLQAFGKNLSHGNTHYRILSKLCSERVKNNILLGLDGWKAHKARVEEEKSRRLEEMNKVALEKDEEILELSKKLQLADIQLELLQKALKNPQESPFRSMKLEDMGLTVRTFNSLRRQGNYSIDDIMRHYSSLEELEKIDGVGKAAAYEILATVRQWYPGWLA